MRLGPATMVLLLVAESASLSAQPPSAEAPTDPDTATPWELFDDLEAAWRQRDVEAYLELWRMPSLARLRLESDFPASYFSADSSELVVERPGPIPLDARRVTVSARLSSITEPRGSFQHWLFALERRAGEWRIWAREPAGQIDGLVHLSLDPAGFRADGMVLRLEDFELQMQRGTLFTSPESVGPTALVFVGKGVVRMRPRLTTERQQLRQFCGEPELEVEIRKAFIRIHPGDLHRILAPIRFDPDPDAARRLKDARQIYEEQVDRTFVLDARLPGSPWWVLPALGDAAVTVETRGKGTLTYSLNGGQAEGISLFDREKRLQICRYPAAGRPTRYHEDDGRSVDVLHHDINARFAPHSNRIDAVDNLRLRILTPSPTLRLKLDEALRVDSVTSDRGGHHLFFRVRHRSTLLVTLGPLAGQVGELNLSVSYGGRLESDRIEREAIQISESQEPQQLMEEFRIEPVAVHSNQRPWYPQAQLDDYATASLRLEVPRGFDALTGGRRRVLSGSGEGRVVVEYEQERPGKYITVAVGRLERVGARTDAVVPLEGFGLPRTRRLCEDSLDQATDILSFFTQAFGPFPYPSLRLAVIEGRTPGGHSPPGMVLIQHRPVILQAQRRSDPADFSGVKGFFLAHELAHQWWGHGIAGESYHERWLSEAMAQYAAARWAGQAHGENAFRDILRRFGRWARRETHKGPISLGYRLGHIEQDARIYRAVVYNKGAYVLHMLRGIVGDEAFTKGLSALQTERRFEKIGADDLRQALEEVSGRDLRPYFETWIDTVVLPTLTWSESRTQTESGHRTQVRVRADQLPGEVPLEIAVSHGDGREVRRVWLRPGDNSFTIDTSGQPRKVEINDDLGILAEVEKQKSGASR